MAENRKHIDELSRDALQDFQEVTPPQGVWRRIRFRLLFPGMNHFSRLNVIIPALIILGGLAGIILTGTEKTDEKYTQREKNLELLAYHQASKDQGSSQHTHALASAKGQKQDNVHKAENKSSTEVMQKTYYAAPKGLRKHNQNSNQRIEVVTHKQPAISDMNYQAGPKDFARPEYLPGRNHIHLSNSDSDKMSYGDNYQLATLNNQITNHFHATVDQEINLANNQGKASSPVKTESDEDKKTENQSTETKTGSETNIAADDDNNNQPVLSETKLAEEEQSQISLFSPAEISFQFYGGIQRTAFDLKSEGSSALREFRSQNETASWSYMVGGGINLDYGGYFLESGLNYNLYRSEANYSYEKIYIDSMPAWNIDTSFITHVDTVNAYYDSIHAQWHYEIDTLSIAEYDSISAMESDSQSISKQVQTFQELKYWEFPIMFGKYWNFGNLNLETGLGIALGFYSGSSGHIIRDAEYTLVKYNKQNLPFRDVSLIGLGKIRAVYRMNDRWSITGDLNMRYSFNSIYDDEFPVKQKPYSIGMNIGIRYKL